MIDSIYPRPTWNQWALGTADVLLAHKQREKKMIPYWKLDGSQLYQGNVLDVLAALYEAGIKVHCTVTSPPYWGLRDYGLPPIEWGPVSYAPMAGLAEIDVPGCDPGCRHEWGDGPMVTVGRNDESPEELQRRYEAGYRFAPSSKTTDNNPRKATAGQYCHLCGGWRGSLGLEPTVEMFVGHIVLIWRALWRVLRDDGTCWLNLGDSYAGSPAGNKTAHHIDAGHKVTGAFRLDNYQRDSPKDFSNLKPKDLIGIPWRVAFALQADGWYLRSDLIWAKGLSFCPTYSGSCMPESVRDRPTKGHEYVFLLAKQKRYFYDADAVREEAQTAGQIGGLTSYQATAMNRPPSGNQVPGKGETYVRLPGRNLRTVWAINPGSYAGAHFATFPPALVEPMIKAGTSERGACRKCGAPWERCKDSKTVVQSRYENQTMQSMPRTETIRSVSAPISKNVQCLCSKEKERSQTCESGTRESTSQALSGNASRTESRKKSPMANIGAWSGIDACGGAQVQTHEKGASEVKRTIAPMATDGKGKAEQSDSLCSEEGAVTECTGNLHSGGLDSDIRKSESSLQILRSTIHGEQDSNDRSCDASVKGRGAQSREHNSGMSVLQLQEVESPTRQATGKSLTTPRNDGSRWKENDGRGFRPVQVQTTDWRPTCTCDAGEPIPCTVLDSFAGSGTTLKEAIKLGRRAIGIELSKSYCDDHIIPRLTEPLLEWAEAQPEPEQDAIQLGFL